MSQIKKPIGIGNAFNSSNIEYESNGDIDKTWSWWLSWYDQTIFKAIW